MKWLIRILIALVALAALGFVFRKPIMNAAFAAYIKPAKPFADYTPPPVPDYSDDAVWAALPGREDKADFLAGEFTDGQAAAGVDVFFIHPTTYINKAAWNGPLDDQASRDYVDDGVMRAQASAFNGCCAVYAPRYRQATFWSFIDETGEGQKALNLAYGDVALAFDEFLARTGDRPFILAAHSQGSAHLSRLLSERVSGTPLMDRFVAAYPIGIPLYEEKMQVRAPDIPICETPAQTGCYVTYNSLGAKAEIWPDYENSVCVNPLTWRKDTPSSDADTNGGSLALPTKTAAARLEAGVTGAVCESNRLLVGPFQSDLYDDLPMNLGRDNFHILDYSLFYASIRENAAARADAFMAR